jgi:thiol-disulfide isomerase/thioredoxin
MTDSAPSDGDGAPPPGGPSRTASPSTVAPGAGPGLVARIGLALRHPRWALTLAADRSYAGRSGSDLVAAMAGLLLATQLRGLASAVWLGTAVEAGLGVRAAIRVLTGALTVDLGLLVVGALVVFGLAGARRNLGRAFDLACVAALPLVFVDLGATVVVRTAGLVVPGAVGWILSGASYGWMGALIALAVRPARGAPPRVPEPPADATRSARRVGWAVAAVAAIGFAGQAAWIVDHLELVRPMTTGDAAPALALARVDAAGALGPPVTLASTRGKVTVLDFWATWCGPCLIAMPRLEKLVRTHPDVVVIAINLDDPAAARALFDQRGYTMTLLADDGDTSQRYGVSSIPHTVIIDRGGVVRNVVRGTAGDIAALVDAAASR